MTLGVKRAASPTLLIIVHSEYPLGEPRVRRQAMAATEAGWDVEILCLATTGAPDVEVIDGSRIHRTHVMHRRRMTTVGLAREYGRFWLASLSHCLLSRRHDVVVVANPPDFLVLATLPQRLLGARVVLDVHDLMTDLFQVRLSLRQEHPVMQLLSWTERLSMRYADAVVTVHEPYAAEIRRRTQGHVDPTVVMNSADTHWFQRRQYEPQGQYTVMYHGSLIDRYGVLDLLEAFRRMVCVYPDSILWLLGDGDTRKTILARVDSTGFKKRVWVSDGMLPSEQIRDLLPRASLGVIPNQPNRLNAYALSTKLFEYVQTGVPVLCADLPTLRAHFSETELLFFTAGSVDDLAAKLRWARAHPGEMRQRADAAYDRCQKEYAWPEQRRRFLTLLASS